MIAALEDLAAAYRERGVAVLREALDAAVVADLHVRSLAVWDRVQDDPGRAEHLLRRAALGGGRVVDRVDRYFALDPELDRFAWRPEVTAPTAALIGTPVWVLKDKFIRKEAGTDGYGPHQDYPYYAASGLPAGQLVSVLVPLASAPAEAGPIEVVPGSHGALLAQPGALDPAPAAVPAEGWEPVSAEPGDLVFLHPLLLHRSAPNRSRVGRPIVFVTYGSGPGGDERTAAVEASYRTGARSSVDAGGSGLVPPVSAAPVTPASGRASD